MKQNFKDIYKIYNISNVTDECIKININRGVKNVYVYKIDPVVMLSASDELIVNISNTYVEFLKEFNLEYQILVVNRKLDVHKYLDEYTNTLQINENKKLMEIYYRYITDLKEKLEAEDIFETNYYVIVAIKDLDKTSVDDVDKCIYKLNKIGCRVARVVGKQNLTDMLYECINKEKI